MVAFRPLARFGRGEQVEAVLLALLVELQHVLVGRHVPVHDHSAFFRVLLVVLHFARPLEDLVVLMAV